MNNFMIEFVQHQIRGPVIKKIQKIYDENMDSEDGSGKGKKERIKEFRNNLKDISKWNVSEVNEVVADTKAKCPKLGKLLTVIMKKYASDVLDESDLDEVFIKDVNEELFVHKVCIKVGTRVMYDISIMDERIDGNIRVKKFMDFIQDAVESAISDMFPIDEVISKASFGNKAKVETGSDVGPGLGGIMGGESDGCLSSDESDAGVGDVGSEHDKTIDVNEQEPMAPPPPPEVPQQQPAYVPPPVPAAVGPPEYPAQDPDQGPKCEIIDDDY